MNPLNPVLGTEGDFTTSPEISQVFGELLAVWLLSQWLHVGKVRKIRLVELGPGRGTLTHDILRVLSQFPSAREAVEEVHLVETSLSMRSRQEGKLVTYSQEYGWALNWHGSIDDVSPDASKYTMIVAHEFFDALPFHLIQKTQQGWQEILITSTPDPAACTVLQPSRATNLDFTTTDPTPTLSSPSTTRFRRILSPTPTPSSTLLGLSSNRFKQLPVGSQIEVSPAAFKIARRVGELVCEAGGSGVAGSALIVDYGGDRAYGNSFRAFKEHKIVDVFHRPGECDLTTNVDFAYLKEATADLALSLGPLSQAAFLTRMGLPSRVEALKKSASSQERGDAIEKAAQRLVDPTRMGAEYKIMAMTGRRDIEPNIQERWPFVDGL
ncbi:uncharacterized protein FIBRA_01325 [Fibroporia radiculosa]|uniref:Protein arginine methyltransferase NDUFAF7 n=1 Tax=Fibroporia radiculosa TaxID=599839 RepID=J4H115_9APHY|nr:uncharacterized protein FIBRA_01325 [Fibroporia radiculosa]CCL99309.1 predicted protein [Fibroporia radiculosa]